MKPSIIWSVFLVFILSACAANQLNEAENAKAAAFTRGESLTPEDNHKPGQGLRSGPDDIRYQVTEKDPKFYDASFTLHFISLVLSKFDYHQPEDHWEGLHLESVKMIEGLDANLDSRERLTKTEAIAFIVLDKYLNQVSVTQSVADATSYYLERLQQSGSKVELLLVTTSFKRISPYLEKETKESWSSYYNNLIKSVQSSSGANEFILQEAAKAEKMLKSGVSE